MILSILCNTHTFGTRLVVTLLGTLITYAEACTNIHIGDVVVDGLQHGFQQKQGST